MMRLRIARVWKHRHVRGAAGVAGAGAWGAGVSGTFGFQGVWGFQALALVYKVILTLLKVFHIDSVNVFVVNVAVSDTFR